MAAPALDAGFPVLATQTGTTQSLTTGSFDVAANRLVVVLVAYDADPNTNSPSTVSWTGGTPSGAAAFTKATGTSGTSSHVGTFTDVAEVWTSWVTTAVNAQSITCSLAASASTAQDRAVFVGSWANTQSTIGGVNAVFASASGTRSIAVSCTGTGSVVVGICASFFTGGAGVADANSTLDGNGNVGGDTQTALHLSTPTSGPGSFTIGLTGTDTDRVAAAIELLLAPQNDSQSESSQADVLLDAYGPFGPASTAFQSDAFQEDAYQILAAGAAGPNTYNEGVDATALAQDQVATTQAMLASLSESALAQDALATAQIMLASLAESALAQESLAAKALFLSSLSELALAQEGLAASAAFNATLAESALAQETLATTQAMLASLSESALAGDTVSALQSTLSSLSESSLADVLFDATVSRPGAGNTYNEALLESCSAQDALATQQAMGSGVSASVPSAGASVGNTSIFIFDD